MSLFFDLLSSINNPNQQGSVAQLESITNGIQQVAANQGIDSSRLQSILSAVGGFVGPALMQQQKLGGANQLAGLVGQLAGGGSATALQSLFPPQLQQQMIQGVASKTGISPNILQGLLPVVLPAILGLLNMGSAKPGTTGTNPLLAAVAGGDGNVDFGDVFRMSSRFLNPPKF